MKKPDEVKCTIIQVDEEKFIAKENDNPYVHHRFLIEGVSEKDRDLLAENVEFLWRHGLEDTKWGQRQRIEEFVFKREVKIGGPGWRCKCGHWHTAEMSGCSNCHDTQVDARKRPMVNITEMYDKKD